MTISPQKDSRNVQSFNDVKHKYRGIKGYGLEEKKNLVTIVTYSFTVGKKLKNVLMSRHLQLKKSSKSSEKMNNLTRGNLYNENIFLL